MRQGNGGALRGALVDQHYFADHSHTGNQPASSAFEMCRTRKVILVVITLQVNHGISTFSKNAVLKTDHCSQERRPTGVLVTASQRARLLFAGKCAKTFARPGMRLIAKVKLYVAAQRVLCARRIHHRLDRQLVMGIACITARGTERKDNTDCDLKDFCHAASAAGFSGHSGF